MWNENVGEPCPFCGEPEILELAQAWTDHCFLLETCCETNHEAVVAEMNLDPAWATALLRRLGAEELLAGSLRRVADDDCDFLLDWDLVIRPVSFSAAAGFVHRHHAHCGAPTAWRFGASITNGPTLLGVVMVGNPVGRGFSGRRILEVNRLCIRRDVPRPLRWNACSQLYGYAAREAERRGFERIITYTRDDEEGTSLRAAGWVLEAKVRGRSWSSRGRARRHAEAPIDKTRWSRALRPRKAERPTHQHAPAMPMHLDVEW
jgi:hypothetical protein